MTSDDSTSVDVGYTYIDFILVMEGAMSFGLQVNDYSKASNGAYGYTIKLDISEYMPWLIEFIQATNQPLSVEIGRAHV